MILTIKTSKKKEVLDITSVIKKELQPDTHLVNIFVTHTTIAITTADLDPGTDLDMLDAFEKMVPKLNYRHPHDPSHVGDHIMSSIIGTSLILPAENGKLVLGTWQRVVLVEFDGPRERKIIIANLK